MNNIRPCTPHIHNQQIAPLYYLLSFQIYYRETRKPLSRNHQIRLKLQRSLHAKSKAENLINFNTIRRYSGIIIEWLGPFGEKMFQPDNIAGKLLTALVKKKIVVRVFVEKFCTIEPFFENVQLSILLGVLRLKTIVSPLKCNRYTEILNISITI